MSDFHQHGLICTLQRLADTDTAELEARLTALAAEKPVTLILPCHYSELAQPALARILDELAPAKFLREIIVSMNGMDKAGFRAAKEYFSRLPQPHRILWNDGPALGALYRKLADAGLGGFTPGKGFNAWSAFGLVWHEGRSELVAMQDCDVASFRREMLARLCYSCLHPEMAHDYAKMYYSRVTDRIYGRVSRLFLAPLLHALVRVAGHRPLLDFLLSFRYPLAGECAMRRDIAGAVSLRGDWGLEIGLLCEVFRHTEPGKVCQVDGGKNYDHKHQPLGSDAETGLYKMSKQIAQTLFTHLADEGVPMDEAFLPAVRSSYARESGEALRRYRSLAIMNSLPFDDEMELHAVESFARALEEATVSRAAAQPVLASWKRVQQSLPGFLDEFSNVVLRQNEDAF